MCLSGINAGQLRKSRVDRCELNARRMRICVFGINLCSPKNLSDKSYEPQHKKVAAAEAAIGLAIIVVYYRNSGTIRVEEIDKLKG